MAATSPEWASEVTSLTPDRPRAFRPRNRVSQPASDSAEQMSTPRISRCPSALTPVATRTWVLTTRPPSRTFIVNASAARNVYGPWSSGRVRKSSTWASSSLAITETCDLRQPGDAEGLDELLHPARRDPKQVAGRHHRGQRPLGPPARSSSQSGK